MKKRIIFCSHWVLRYRQLIHELLATNRYEIFCEESFLREFRDNERSPISYQTFFPKPNWERIQNVAEGRLPALFDFLASSAKRYIHEYERYSIFQAKEMLAANLRGSLEQVIYMTEVFDALVSTLSPDLLIVDGPGVRQQTWVSTAQKHDVTSLEIYHGTVHVKPELLPRRQIQADFMAMDSALIADIYMSLGIAPEKLRVTGLPKEPIDGLTTEEAAEILAKKYGLDPSRRTVLLFTSYDSGDSLECLFELSSGSQVDIIRQVAAATETVGDRIPEGVQLIIKRHPTLAAAGWDDAEAYRYITARQGIEPIMVDPTENNLLLLAAADTVIVSKYSSTVSEAINADKPVVMPPHLRHWLHDDLLNSGALIFADDQDALQEALIRCLTDEKYLIEIAAKRRDYLKRYPHVDTGEVIGNLISYIDDITYGQGNAADELEEVAHDIRRIEKSE